MSNHRIEDRIWNNMNLAERREVYRQRGWNWNRSRRNRKIVNKRRKKRGGGLVRFLRSYIAYPYRTKTRTLGKGRMVTAVTQLLNGTYAEVTVQSLSAVAFSQEFFTIKENFVYFKILGIGITVMPQNLQTNKNLYFMICWDGEPLDNFRINDSVCIVPPFLTKPKTYFFKIPKLQILGDIQNVFRPVSEQTFVPILQVQAKENTVPWQIRVDVVMEFRTLNSKNRQLGVIYEDDEIKNKEEEILKQERKRIEEIRKELRKQRKKPLNTMEIWEQVFEKDEENNINNKLIKNNNREVTKKKQESLESDSDGEIFKDDEIKKGVEEYQKIEKSSEDCSFEIQKEKNKLEILKEENDKIIKKIEELEIKKENKENEDKDKKHRENLIKKYGQV